MTFLQKSTTCVGLLIVAILGLAAEERPIGISVVLPPSTPVASVNKLDFTLSEEGSKRTIFDGIAHGDRRPGALVVLLDSTNFLPISGRGLNSYTEAIKSSARKALTKTSELPFALYTSNAGSRFHVVRDIVDSEGHLLQKIPALTSTDVENAVSVYSRPMNFRPKIVSIHVTSVLIQKLADVESIAQHFSKIAGHKTLVWFCDGQSFPFPPREGPTYYPIYSAMLALQRADMSLYPVSCFEQKAEEVNERLRRIASATGGRAYHDWTVLEHAIRDASDDVQNSFQLTWTPATMTHTGPVHELRIASNKAPSDALLYRSTYVETVLPHGKEARTVAVQFLLDSPLKVFGLPLRLDVRASGADQLNVDRYK